MENGVLSIFSVDDQKAGNFDLGTSETDMDLVSISAGKVNMSTMGSTWLEATMTIIF